MTDLSSLKAVTNGEVAWAQIDLDAIAHNTHEIKSRIGERVQLMAVLKADAYGHGAVQVAHTVLQSGATQIAVARVAEGIELRRGGITAPILILGYVPVSAVGAVVDYRLSLTVTTLELARALSAEVEARRLAPLPVHIKVDTGMGRFGLLPDEVVDLTQALNAMPGLRVEGLFTHFSSADATDTSYTWQQHRVFMGVLQKLRRAGLTIPLAHEANSAAALRMPETRLDMVRCGIVLYGLQPSSEVKLNVQLRPALSLHSRVARVCTLPAGSAISYGRTYVTSRTTRVALVPLGYGDGYRRLLSNKGSVLIHGRRCPILGRVCMDQCVVDVSSVPDVQLDDEVVALGRQGDEQISAEEIAALAETINYEVTTSIMPRVTRVYLEAGRVVKVRTLQAG